MAYEGAEVIPTLIVKELRAEKLGLAKLPVATQSAYTQTYNTADRTHANVTSSSVATTGSTQTTPFGYTTAAQADAIPVAINAVAADLLDLKQLVNAVIDDLQATGVSG